MVNSLESLIAVHQIGLGCGIYSSDEVISLSDIVIEKYEKVPYEIIEASLMKGAKRDDIESKLIEFHMMGYDRDLINIVLSIIGNKFSLNKIDIVKAVQCCARVLVHSNLYFDREYYNLYRLEDAYDLAEGKVYGDVQEVINEFKNEICNYERYFIEFKDNYYKLLNIELKN